MAVHRHPPVHAAPYDPPLRRARRPARLPAAAVATLLALVQLAGDGALPVGAQRGAEVWLLTGLTFHGTCAERSMSLPPKAAASFSCTFAGAPGQVEGDARLAVLVPLRIEPERPVDVRFAANATVRLIGYPRDRGAFLRVETTAPRAAGRWPVQSVFQNDVGGGTAVLRIPETGADPDDPPRGPFDSETRPLTVGFRLTAGPTAGVGGPEGGVQFVDVEASYAKAPPPPPDLRVVDAKLFQVSEGAKALVAGRLFGLRVVVESTASTTPFRLSATLRQPGRDALRVTDFYPLDPRSMTPAGRLALTDTLRFDGPGSQVVYFASRDPRSPLYLSPRAGAGDVTATIDVDVGNRVAEDNEANNQRVTRSAVVATGWNARDDPNLAVVIFDRGVGYPRQPWVTGRWLRARLQSLFPVMLDGVRVRVTAEGAPDAELDVPPTAASFMRLLRTLLKANATQSGRMVFMVPAGWFARHAPPPLNVKKTFSLPQQQWGVYGRVVLLEPAGFCTRNCELFVAREVAHTYGVPLPRSHVDAVPDGMALPVGETYPWDEFADSVQARRDGLRNAEGRRAVVKSLMSPDAVLLTLSASPFHAWLTGADYNTLLESETLPVPTPASAAATALDDPVRHPAPLAADGAADAASAVVLVSGTIRRDGTATLDPAWLVADGQADVAANGAYAVVLFDAGGRELRRHAVPVQWTLGDADGAPALDAWPLLASVPWHADTARLALQRGTTTLAELRASANPPTIHLDAPNGGVAAGRQSVRWTAADADGDALRFAVQRSGDDGRTWTTLAIDLTEPTFAWDTDDAPGSAATRLRVVASDGLRVAEDTSDAVLTIADKPPQLAIDTPTDGAVYARGEAVVLSGGGDDLEDGTLADTGLAWRSDRDGPLGTGPSVTATDLSIGAHVITLSGADAAGHAVAASRAITVVADAAPDVQVSTDDIAVGPDPVAERDRALLAVTVHARFHAAACTVFVYDGDPRADGRLIGAQDVVVGANAAAGVLVPWTPLGVGRHAVHVRVSGCAPSEADTANDWAMRDVTVGPARLRTVFLPVAVRAYDEALPFQPATPSATPPTPPTPGGQPAPTTTPPATPSATGIAAPTATPTSTADATGTASATPAVTPRPSVTGDPIGTAVAATLTALAATPTPSATADVVATAVAATLTALAPSPAASATPSPTASTTASATPTPSASPAAAAVTLDAVRTTGADAALTRTAFAPGEAIGLWMKLTNTGTVPRRVAIQYEVVGRGGVAPPELSWSGEVEAPPGEHWQHIDRALPTGMVWGPNTFLATLATPDGPVVLGTDLFVGTRLLAADDFANPSSGWGSGETTGIRYGYVDGTFRLLITLANYFARTTGPLSATNALVEADVAHLGAARGAAGLMFGLTQDGTVFGMFAVTTDGRFGVFERRNGVWRAVHALTASPALFTDSTPNHLMLAQHGPELFLYANGHELAAVSDSDAPLGGRLGLYAEAVDAGFEARYDNWRAYALPAR